MLKKNIILSIALSILLFTWMHQAIAFVVHNGNDGDPFIKTWINQVGNRTYALTIEHNPPESKSTHRVKFQAPCMGGYLSDNCNRVGIEIFCSLYDPFFARLVRNDAEHKITVSQLNGCRFDFFDPDHLPSNKMNFTLISQPSH